MPSRLPHPNRSLEEVLAEKASPDSWDKKFVSLKVTPDSDGELAGGLFRPTDEQLEQINLFTRTPKTADEVICFTTLSCNNIVDRSTDRFTDECIVDFAQLPEPYSSVGKSYLVGHDTEKLPVGRIFDVGTKQVDVNGEKALFLTNGVYMPNTESNKAFIENLDFGVYWAVSVGVVLEQTACTVCGKAFSGWGWWCLAGHVKGLYYDPDSEEEDEWGWPIPVDSSDKNAVWCVRELFQPKDFYELSQVYLGAQFMAGLDKTPLGGVVKAASASHSSIINLTERDAESLPLPTKDDKLAEALRRYETVEDEDGTIRWTDEQGLIWVYSVTEEEGGKVLCLGKEAEEEEPPSEPDQGDTQGSEESAEVEDDPEEEVESSPAPTTSIAEEVTERISTLEDELETLRSKALVGEAYLAELRADTLNWYVMAHRDLRQPEGKGAVDTSPAEKLLDALGNQIDLIKQLRDEYKTLAQAKFPQAVRRSSFESDPHERSEPSPLQLSKEEAEKVKKLHG